MLFVEIKQGPDRASLILVDFKSAPNRIIAERDLASHPQALAFGICDLVANALSCHLALELSE